MAGIREIPKEIVDREFDIVQSGSQRYLQSRSDPSCVLLLHRYNETRGVYETTETQEGEYWSFLARGGK